MTTTEICAAARASAPRIQLRDVWFVLRQMQQRNLARCLNPRHVTGKLYVLTLRGRRVVQEAFGLEVPAEAKGLDWRKYACVARAKVRRAVLLALAEMPSEALRMASAIRKRLRDQHGLGLNATLRALKDLEKMGLVQSEPVSDGERRRAYYLTNSGVAIAQRLST